MFSDRVCTAEGFESSWKDKKESINESSQTTEFFTKEQGTNTSGSVNVRTQTDAKNSDVSTSVDMDKLASWLTNISSDMINELKDESVSNAMASLKLNSNSLNIAAQKLQKIDYSTSDGQPNYVTDLSWNSTGNTLAIAYSYSHETWCHHEGTIHLYTLNRNDEFPSIPSKKYKCPACVISLSFHPSQPAILAAATVSGEILLWNGQDDNDINILSTNAEHEDRVTQLSWVTNIDMDKPQTTLVSSSIDSSMILWTVDFDESLIKVQQKFAIGRISKNISSAEAIGKNTDGGIVKFDFSPHISGLFVIGMEGGTVIKCSIVGAKPLSTNETSLLNKVMDPSVYFYEKHDGDLTSIKFSPHRKDLFLSSATDNEIKIFQIEQITPVQIIFMDATLYSVSWVIYEEKLLIGCSDNGSIRLYSLLNGQLIPNVAECSKVPLLKMAINHKRPVLTAFGNEKAQVELWSIPWNNIAAQDSYNVYGKVN